MKITERLRKDSESEWKKIINHPFVVELYTGTLPMEKFNFYILQDYHYLVTAIKNFGVIASRADSVETMREVVEILHLESTSEFEGYGDLLIELGHTIEEASEIEPVPASVSYGSFLLSTSSTRPFAESITSVLPCFWSYAEIASSHRDRIEGNSNGIYREWAEVYLTDSYLSLVEKIKGLVNAAGERYQYDRLKNVFITASRYEHMFWDAVYNKDNWNL